MADEQIKLKPSDIEQLIAWLRSSGQPQSLPTLTRHLLAILREEAQNRR